MKKILLSLSCAVALALASCGGGSSVAGTFNGITKQLEKAQTAEQVIKIATEGEAKINKLAEKYGDGYEPSDADLEAIENTRKAMMEACERTGVDPDQFL